LRFFKVEEEGEAAREYIVYGVTKMPNLVEIISSSYLLSKLGSRFDPLKSPSRSRLAKDSLDKGKSILHDSVTTHSH
jgi:hypothetical protein